MTNKKVLLLIILILSITVIIFGCTQPAEEDNTKKEDNNAIETNIEESVEGTFTGWVDSSSFEIMSDDTPVTIRTSDEVLMPDDALEGRNVRITYLKNDQGQNIIKTIKVLD